MDEEDVLDQAELLEQHRAHQAVEVTPGNQPVSLHRHRNLLTGRQTPLSPFLVGGELWLLDSEQRPKPSRSTGSTVGGPS